MKLCMIQRNAQFLSHTHRPPVRLFHLELTDTFVHRVAAIVALDFAAIAFL